MYISYIYVICMHIYMCVYIYTLSAMWRFHPWHPSPRSSTRLHHQNTRLCPASFSTGGLSHLKRRIPPFLEPTFKQISQGQGLESFNILNTIEHLNTIKHTCIEIFIALSSSSATPGGFKNLVAALRCYQPKAYEFIICVD